MEPFARIAVLINNPGVGCFKCLFELTVEEWDLVINTNFRGLCCLKRGDCFINSLTGRIPGEIRYPAGRVGHPEDMARACFFLSDCCNDFVTGANIVIDGGMTPKMIYLD